MTKRTRYSPEVNEKRPGQWLVGRSVVVEIQGSDKPALIAEIVLLHIVGDST